MRKYVKNGLQLFLCLCAIFLFTSGCGCDKKEETPQTNTNVETKAVTFDDQTVEGLNFTGASIVYDDEISQIVVTVQNTQEQAVTVDTVNMSFYDKDDNLLVQTVGYVGDELAPGESSQIVSNVTEDLREATKVVYEIAR